MELFSKGTFYAYQKNYLFPLATTSRGDVLAMGNPSKEGTLRRVNMRQLNMRNINYKKGVRSLGSSGYVEI